MAQTLVHTIMFVHIYLISVLSGWIIISAFILYNSRRILYLKETEIARGIAFPTISMIVPVRNEEKNLRAALLSLTRIRYPHLKIIYVNDRSEDDSSKIIEDYADKFSNIQLIQINELPKEWIGKSYALFQGSKIADSEWILFTDADVCFQEDSLIKSMSFCLQKNADHLTVIPEIKSPSIWVNMLNSLFSLLLLIKYTPWKVNQKKSAASFGMGAFNLIRSDVYKSIGTHQAFALHPNDDLMLGVFVKQAGFQQEVLYGNGSIQYAWYDNISAFLNGLLKNAFSSMEYKYQKLLMSVAGAFILFINPVPVALLHFNLQHIILIIAIIGCQLSVFLLRKGSTALWWHALFIPLSMLMLVYSLLRSAVFTLCKKGIVWRDRFYEVADVKKYSSGF